MSPESSLMRDWLIEKLWIMKGGTVVDLGCGRGEDLEQIAKLNPQASRLLGLDLTVPSEDQTRDPRIEFMQADLSEDIPLDDSSVHAIYSLNLLECISDQERFIEECARALRPAGSLVLAHFDWDTQTFDGPDRKLVREIVHAYNDWQQDWMPAIDPWAGRKIWPMVMSSGHFEGDIQTYTLTSNCFEPGCYGRDLADSFAGLVRRGIVTAERYEEFYRSLAESAERGRFFFSVTLYAFVGEKR